MMKLVPAFFRLIRWPNLVFIVITQVLFYYCIILPAFGNVQPGGLPHFLDWNRFWLLSFSSVLIAAAGYIINDYFDLNIDQVNKPDAIVIQKIIKRRWAIFWHFLLSLIGVMIAMYVSWKIGSWLVGPINLLCVFLLLFYSTTFKKKFLIGNIIISLLTAWVVLVLYMSELDIARLRDPVYHHTITRVFKVAVLYAGFAFVISLIREVIKDMEDMQGDERYGCRTMPIVWGMPATKVFAGVWLIVLILAVLVILVYGMMQGWWLAAVYSVFLVIMPLTLLLSKLYSSVSQKDFHQVSTWIKIVMLTGILSMLFFKFHI